MSNKIHQIFASAAVLALASVVAWLSYTQEPANAFLFPRLIAMTFVGLAVIGLLQSLWARAETADTKTMGRLKKMFPGLLIVAVLIFFAAKALGFYLASSIAFFILFSLYDHASHHQIASWGKRLLVTVLFMLVIYGLFAVLLQVQTPRGIVL